MEEFQRNLDFCSHFFRKWAHYFVNGRSTGSFRNFVSIFVGFLGLPSDFFGGNHGLASVDPHSAVIVLCMLP